MSWGPNLAVLLAGAALLGGMMATAPGYDSTIRPFAIHAAPGEWADGRVFDARFLGGQLTREIGFQRYGQDIIRDSNGVFLIADFEVSGVTASTRVAAVWRGGSGRDYLASGRFDGAPGLLAERWFQPGLTDQTQAIFELPEDEVQGGTLILTRLLDPALDSALYLEPQGIAAVTPRQELSP